MTDTNYDHLPEGSENVQEQPTVSTEQQNAPDMATIGNELPEPEPKSEAEETIAELEERIKRLHAEFENFRRRKEEETERAKLYALERVISEILPVIDNFERAIAASEISENYAALKEGLLMVNKQLRGVLEKEGLSEIDCSGALFDPELHQVVQCVVNDECEEDTILQEIRKGYKLKEKVIRPSMVIVAKKS